MNVRFVRDKISRKLEAGISHVRSFIENAEGLRRLHVHRKCLGIAEDLENVLYDLTNGEIYEAMKYLGDIIIYLKKND